MSVGENIRKIRIERGLSIRKLAAMVNVGESYIRAYETGKRNPKIQSLEAIAKALDVNIEVLTDTPFDSISAMHT